MPNIFSVVVDAVFRHWESLVEEKTGRDSKDKDAAQTSGRTIRESGDGQRRMEELHTRLKVRVEFFYADYGMVDSTELGWLQTVFDTLTGLFDRVVLKINVNKTVRMVCHTCQEAGV